MNKKLLTDFLMQEHTWYIWCGYSVRVMDMTIDTVTYVVKKGEVIVSLYASHLFTHGDFVEGEIEERIPLLDIMGFIYKKIGS